jgi:hypothetical protein
MKRQLVEKLTEALIVDHQTHRSLRQSSPSETVTPQPPTFNPQLSTLNSQDPDAIPDHLMTCHHCIRYANGMCSKETGQKATPLWLRNGAHTFRLEFDCRNCLMYVLPENKESNTNNV